MSTLETEPKKSGLMDIETLIMVDKACGDILSHGFDPKNPTEAPEIRENTSEDIFEAVWGKIISVCSLCYHETRENDRKENHAFDCDRR